MDCQIVNIIFIHLININLILINLNLNMLHELLLALFGHTGSIIIEDQDSFKVNPTLDFLTPAEVELLNRIS